MSSSYDELADKVIRDFIRSVVLIDDGWSPPYEQGRTSTVGADQVYPFPEPTPPPSAEYDGDELADPTSTFTASTNNPDYLWEIGETITNQGFLFTGFAYKDEKKEVAQALASKSDVLVLDWFLAAKDSRPALELLRLLEEQGSPRFVFILTDQSPDDVRKGLGTLGEIKGDDRFFNCGSHVFTLMNKPGGTHEVRSGEVLDRAVEGIRKRFGGLLQLASLELFGQYRSCLHQVLDQFHSDTDFPFILEWLEEDSPICDSHAFNALAIDAWSATVAKQYPATIAQIINKDAVSACLSQRNKVAEKLSDSDRSHLIGMAKKCEEKFSDENGKGDALIESLDKWIDSSESRWPTSLKGLNRGSSWKKENIYDLTLKYLCMRMKVESHTTPLIALDSFFQCQAGLPLKLQQGTILKDDEEAFFICITTSCDCARPDKVKNRYTFIEAKHINPNDLNQYPADLVVAVRTTANDHMLLAIEKPKPPLTYQIDDPKLTEKLCAKATFKSDAFFELEPVAQLRPSRVQALVSLAAGKSIEVGLDRSELLRKLCNDSQKKK